MRPGKLLLACLFLALLGGGYTAWWMYLAGTVRDQLDAWAIEERRNAGFVEVGALTIGGFPLDVTAVADSFSIRRADGSEWQGTRLTGRLAPWKPSEIRLTFEGRHEFSVPVAGPQPAIDLVAQGGSGRISLPAHQGRFVLTDITVDRKATAKTLDIAIDRPPEPPLDHTQTGLTVQAHLSGIHLPEDIQVPLGRSVEMAALTARVKGALPSRLDRMAVSDWSTAGGTVEVDSLSLAWGPLRLAANGTMALDRNLQPMGALSAEIHGLNPTLDTLAGGGVLRTNDATMAKVALGLLSRRKTADGQPIVDASLTVQDGWFFVGPIRLARIPPLPWPG